MCKIADFVKERAEKFGAAVKIAADYAALLDSPLLALNGNDMRARAAVARDRQKVFEEFCAVCAKAGVEDPGLDYDEIFCLLPQAAGEEDCKLAARVNEVVREQLAGVEGADAEKCRALALAIRLMPEMLSSFPPSGLAEALLAQVNLFLFSLGKEMIRPDHSKLKFGDASGRPRPPKPLRVLIVDDDRDAVIRSFRALAGLPDVEIGALVAYCDYGADVGKALSEAAQAVVGRAPDIVLMDQGLGRMEGSDLIRKIGEVKPDHGIVFVGNSGGDPHRLNEAGAIGNCNKGQDLGPLIRAFGRFRAE